jgi:hypothetical protein
MSSYGDSYEESDGDSYGDSDEKLSGESSDEAMSDGKSDEAMSDGKPHKKRDRVSPEAMSDGSSDEGSLKGSLKELFEKDTNEERLQDIEEAKLYAINNPKNAVKLRKILETGRRKDDAEYDAEYGAEHDARFAQPKIIDDLQNNYDVNYEPQIWEYVSQRIPEHVIEGLTKILNEDLSFFFEGTEKSLFELEVIQGNHKYYFENHENDCYITYTAHKGAATFNIDDFFCHRELGDSSRYLPKGSGQFLLLVLLQNLFKYRRYKFVTITALPLIKKSEIEGKTQEQLNEDSVKLPKFYNAIGFDPLTILNETETSDNQFRAPILQVIYFTLVYKKTPEQISLLHEKLNSKTVEQKRNTGSDFRKSEPKVGGSRSLAPSRKSNKKTKKYKTKKYKTKKSKTKKRTHIKRF